MKHCGPSVQTPSISVTLKDYKSGCQCVPAPNPNPPPPHHRPSGGPTADKLTTPRAISLSGDASGSAYFDGSSDVDIAVSIPTISNIELDELVKGGADVNGAAFLDSNGLLFLLEKIKAMIEDEAGSSVDIGELTDQQISNLFNNIEILHGGDANGTG